MRLVRHSHRKRGETDRPRLRSTAPALDPTEYVPPDDGAVRLIDSLLVAEAATQTKHLHGWRNEVVPHSESRGRAVLNKDIEQDEHRLPHSDVTLQL